MQQTVLPRWSPDGQVIAFMGRHFGQKWGIFTVAATGENLHALSFGNRNEGDPDWSPDGAQLVFGNVMGPSDTIAIYILDLRTRHVSTVTGSTDHFSPRWSPDGRFIVAMRSADRRLDMFELATQKWTTLTQIAAGYPNWSHAGKHVYFLNTLNGRRAVFRAGITDGTVQEVTGLTAVERGPFFMGDWVGLAPDDSPMAVRNLTTEDIYSWDFQDR
jgi:Tol biopolymer transport system component